MGRVGLWHSLVQVTAKKGYSCIEMCVEEWHL